ncbi:hypothetical protein P029_00745 [Anaplasma phagocytophilum str. Norway variant2]|uniref:Uncharacterized protein n=1 Tax=Anaplasma phagocytophilum str. Norway variant2 TaxID=1392507 RepID=A0A161IJ85_ANAPH|nr:hypothetical protein P029_00745 [Anaplasma phagocytophilum str. Norway variant2]
MMLLLGRLITLLLLLLRLLVKTLLNLPMLLLEFLTLISATRFVRRKPKVLGSMVSMLIKPVRRAVTTIHRYVVMMGEVIAVVVTTQRFSSIL